MTCKQSYTSFLPVYTAWDGVNRSVTASIYGIEVTLEGAEVVKKLTFFQSVNTLRMPEIWVPNFYCLCTDMPQIAD